jgi:integrase
VIFSKNLKAYARDAGIEKIHIHQTRHTFARIISEETGSIVETQDALGQEILEGVLIQISSFALSRTPTYNTWDQLATAADFPWPAQA